MDAKTGLIHQCPKRSDAFKFTKSVNLPTGSTPESQQKSSLEKVTEGITALKMFSDLAIAKVEGIGVDVNQTRIIVKDLQKKMDRLLNLVFTSRQQMQQEQGK